MLGNIVYNLKNKLKPNGNSDYEFSYEDNSTTNNNTSNTNRSHAGILASFRLNKLFNLKYLSVNQSDDEDCHKSRYFMFPRVYSQHPPDSEIWSPISLAPTPKLPEYMDNVIDKFVRVIHLDGQDLVSDRLNANLKTPQKIQKMKNRRNDREEIRRRLAMGAEDDYLAQNDKPTGKKPSLQSRLQNGMNLQICFMNETASDTESPSSDSESCPKLSKINYPRTKTNANANPYSSRPLTTSKKSGQGSYGVNSKARPSSLQLGPPLPEASNDDEVDFFTKQSRLQIEARMALSQAKDMAHMQMEIERQKQRISPITEVIRNSLIKVGYESPEQKRRMSRQMLTDMNIAQLQIIVNDLHTHIEKLNESLVQFLMERDELHMSQDSMLVDIEDLTRYLTAKEGNKSKDKNSKTTTPTNQLKSLKPSPSAGLLNNNIKNQMPMSISEFQKQQHQKYNRIVSLVRK